MRNTKTVLWVAGLFLILSSLMGCTQHATKLAIQNYEESEQYKELAFNNSYRIAREQMFLNLQQFIQANKTRPDIITRAVAATEAASRELEECRIQYLYGQSLSRVTVGQYLYDQQGPFNVILEAQGKTLKKVGEAGVAAKNASGIGVKDLLPRADTPTRTPSGEAQDDFDKLLNQLKGAPPSKPTTRPAKR